MIIVIVHSAYSCGGICCNGDTSSPNVVYVTPHGASYPQSQYVQGPNGQNMMMVNQPPPESVFPHQQLPYPQSPVTAAYSTARQMPPEACVQRPAEANCDAKAVTTPQEYNNKV